MPSSDFLRPWICSQPVTPYFWGPPLACEKGNKHSKLSWSQVVRRQEDISKNNHGQIYTSLQILLCLLCLAIMLWFCLILLPYVLTFHCLCAFQFMLSLLSSLNCCPLQHSDSWFASASQQSSHLLSCHHFLLQLQSTATCSPAHQFP